MMDGDTEAPDDPVYVVIGGFNFARGFLTMLKPTSRYIAVTAGGLLRACLVAPAQAATFNFWQPVEKGNREV